jgi:hypothetical protein
LSQSRKVATFKILKDFSVLSVRVSLVTGRAFVTGSLLVQMMQQNPDFSLERSLSRLLKSSLGQIHPKKDTLTLGTFSHVKYLTQTFSAQLFDPRTKFAWNVIVDKLQMALQNPTNSLVRAQWDAWRIPRDVEDPFKVRESINFSRPDPDDRFADGGGFDSAVNNLTLRIHKAISAAVRRQSWFDFSEMAK